MFIYHTQVRVRYAETDQMGFVYYGNYATYYEVARVESFRFLGYPYRQLEEEGLMMPVLDLHTRYIQPAKYDDLLTIKVMIKAIPTVRILFEYEVHNEQEVLLNTGNTTLVFIDGQSKKPRRCPKALIELLKPHILEGA